MFSLHDWFGQSKSVFLKWLIQTKLQCVLEMTDLVEVAVCSLYDCFGLSNSVFFTCWFSLSNGMFLK